MQGINKVTLIGHLGADPVVRDLSDGKKAAFSVATSDSWKDKRTGERRSRTEWHRVVTFNQGLVGIAEQYLRKGSMVYIEGTLRSRKWTDQGGVERYSTEVVLEPFSGVLTMLDNRPEPQDGDSPAAETASETASSETDPDSGDDLSDAIPF